MEYLRWILLVVAILVVAGVYLRGRARRKSMDYSPLDAANDVPSFSAQEADDAWREDAWQDGVGPVRVVSREADDPVAETLEAEPVDAPAPPSPPPEIARPAPAVEPNEPDGIEPVDSPEAVAEQQEQQPALSDDAEQSDISEDDVIVLYVVADRGQELKGEQILSATIATRLEYGDMKIFHRREGDNILFSMANMKEPGWFDYDNMNELRTRGVSLFIQLGLCENPVDALDEMLVCAHTLASMLNARMCDASRQLLNEAVAKSLREKARYYYDLKHGKTEHQHS